MNKNENNVSPEQAQSGERIVWTCPVCRISCDDRFCPMCGISREVALAFSGTVEQVQSSGRAESDETGNWPSVSASAEKNELYRQRISDSEALKGLTSILNPVPESGSKDSSDNTDIPAEAPAPGAAADSSVKEPSASASSADADIRQPKNALPMSEEEEIEYFNRPRERTKPIPGDTPVDIGAELDTLTAHSRLDAPVIDIPDRPAYKPYVRPAREKTKLPRTSAASPEPLLPPELTPVFDDLPSEPLPEDRPEGYVSPAAQDASAQQTAAQKYQPSPSYDIPDSFPDIPQPQITDQYAPTAESEQPFVPPVPENTHTDGAVTKYDTAQNQKVRPRRAARRADTSETPIQPPMPQTEGQASNNEAPAHPAEPGEKQIVYVETGDKAGLWKPVAIIGILLSALLLLALTYVYVKYAVLIPKYGESAEISIIDAITGRAGAVRSGADDTEPDQTQAAITAVPDPVPETDAPETEPETTVPETEPETTVPETETETTVPETEPETTTPETET
ncbi:MAG: hypothetical protein IJT56_08685, partial [Clostridia bacterium]|nr:hypothetical protein [Clostridia bacterium]